MTTLLKAVTRFQKVQKKSHKPLAVILAGHNGSGKSTLWYERGLAGKFQIPLINADRMMLSILPAVEPLPKWASKLRDKDASWMGVAQKGVEAFIAQAMAHEVPFAVETVFSYWKELEDGRVESKIDLIRKLQDAGYFVVLFFVGLASDRLSIARVQTRVKAGGHNVEEKKLQERFPRTQRAIKDAVRIADAALLVDNSGERRDAFIVCRIQMGNEEIYDSRKIPGRISRAALQWLNVVCPEEPSSSTG